MLDSLNYCCLYIDDWSIDWIDWTDTSLRYSTATRDRQLLSRIHESSMSRTPGILLMLQMSSYMMHCTLPNFIHIKANSLSIILNYFTTFRLVYEQTVGSDGTEYVELNFSKNSKSNNKSAGKTSRPTTPGQQTSIGQTGWRVRHGGSHHVSSGFQGSSEAGTIEVNTLRRKVEEHDEDWHAYIHHVCMRSIHVI